MDSIVEQLGSPCVLKQPDSAFSQGVMRADSAAQFTSEALWLLQDSDVLIAQGFISTPFDWGVGIVDREPLYACKYFMAAVIGRSLIQPGTAKRARGHCAFRARYD